ncbi:hypothetical protein [Noviherbaspirillum pedocola]|uniref:Uncharacterized protein n=1 Tax=Noviherbaspirillum pedocola TaxID=2801341 RepID=A0A934SYK0_9BURK|nr:hypothetical protein [Noviherbaspirillum pedocola]MBK4738915.1 hypothetical protein [Noviherbaspirillum pedocola]
MLAALPSTASFFDSRFLFPAQAEEPLDEFDPGAASADGLVAIELEVEEIVLD